MKVNVVEEVAEGRAHVSWSTVRSKHNGKELIVFVFRDAMKFDGVPALTWDWKPVQKGDRWYTDEIFDGVRLPATAEELQMIADLCGCLMLTPKIIDLIYLQADLKFNPVTNTLPYPGASPRARRIIVANSHIHRVHAEIEEKVANTGGDDGKKLIAVVGKYWVLINHLLNFDALLYGKDNACNYGWLSTGGRYRAVTAGLKCWQAPGYKHNHHHWDPSQTIRLMYRIGILIHEDGRREEVDLRHLAGQYELAPLIHHETGPLRYLRQLCVPEPGSDVSMDMYRPSFDLAA